MAIEPILPAAGPRPREASRDQGDPAVDHGDLAALYDAYGPAVYRLALRLCRSSHAAEDLVQDVFLRYWQQGRYDPKRGPVLAYLLLLTRSMALNRLAQRRNRWQILQQWSTQLLAPSEPSAQHWAELNDLGERMRQALEGIAPNQRQVLELAYYQGLSQSAIAERLAIPLGTVKTRSRQGLLALRRHLVDFHGDAATAPSLPRSHP
ncbi:sigma-70 family RNA polymerase sigma factor [Cyanobium sp. NIES-981]|uniref:sigma-70 family RNA polymerase sigma factor n=1 Tax=Cyanobium sp. NIES-981 TaxID=1851505 RepID=UPI0007DD4D3A|nr:sigma-70 family RNA polymerase sigma factor [Cyanobium sp. NIES-981]SBO42845.1 RNA polymerase sigma-70 factor [Cyanobium sp. NIES-981]